MRERWRDEDGNMLDAIEWDGEGDEEINDDATTDEGKARKHERDEREPLMADMGN